MVLGNYSLFFNDIYFLGDTYWNIKLRTPTQLFDNEFKLYQLVLTCQLIARFIPERDDRPSHISHNAIDKYPHNVPFGNRNVHTDAYLCYKIIHCGLWNWCIIGFVQRWKLASTLN